MKANIFFGFGFVALDGSFGGSDLPGTCFRENEKNGREFEPTWESLQNYKVPEWFRKCQIWYLGTLGTVMCGRVRRLDGAFSLFGRFAI